MSAWPGRHLLLFCAAPLLLSSLPLSARSPFATRVVAFAPAPGHLVNDARFNDPAAALGPPVGGGALSPDSSKLVSLGGFGGSITLAFDSTVPDLPPSAKNPRGLDAIVFGNAFFVGGDPSRRFAEPATIEVSLDANGNGLADDAWYLIPGSHLTAPVAVARGWDDTVGDAALPPSSAAWVPPGRTGAWTTSGFMLPADPFAGGPVLANPNGPTAAGETAAGEGVWGYADCTPTVALGDRGDGTVDAGATPGVFYCVPDDPFVVGVTPGSGGGDAFDIAWAVHPGTGLPAGLPGFDFVRITTAVDAVDFRFGEVSAEIGGVSRVRVAGADPDWNADGEINGNDISDYINSWYADVVFGTDAADFDGDGETNGNDVGAFINAWYVGLLR